MINSMTGFGRGNAGRGKNRIDVEIRAINSRYLDIKFRGIQLDFQLEQEIKKIIEKEIQRGSVYVHVELTNDLDSRKFTFDKDRFESLRDIIKSVYVSYGQRLSLSDVVTTNDLLKTENTHIIDSKVVIKAISNAIVQLKNKKKEGYEAIQLGAIKVSDAKKRKVKNPSKINYLSFLRDTSIATSTMMVKRSLIGKTKFTDTKICEDYYFKCKLLTKTKYAYCLNQYLTKYIKGGPHNVSIGEWTDDTSMALALATSLIEKKCFDGSLALQCACERVLSCRLYKQTECSKLPDELYTLNVHERSAVN